jgi:hypothetical protein
MKRNAYNRNFEIYIPLLSVSKLVTQQSAPVGISCTFNSVSASQSLTLFTSPVTAKVKERCSQLVTRPAVPTKLLMILNYSFNKILFSFFTMYL